MWANIVDLLLNHGISVKLFAGTKQGTAKTVAIVLGATAAAGFVVAILLCTKSVFKKKPSKHHYGGG